MEGCPDCKEREELAKRKKAVEEEYNKGIDLLRKAADNIYEAYKLFEALKDNLDLHLHFVEEMNSHDGSFSIRDFVEETSNGSFEIHRKLDMFIYEHEVE